MVLYIDTHFNSLVIILFKEGKIDKIEEISDIKDSSTIILTTIEKVIGNANIESIIVCNGPGSFTGVRLGVTIAKTLAYAKNIPIRTITSLECLRLSNNADIVAFSDNNGYYVGDFINNNSFYLSNSEFKTYMVSHEISLGNTFNYERIYESAMAKQPENPHSVNPVYIKKLDVEK